MKRTVFLVVAAVLMISSSALFAHHSFAATYREDEAVMIEGELVAFLYRNPHSFVHVMAPDPAGNLVRWSVEWGAVAQLNRQGVDRYTLKPGDKCADHRRAVAYGERSSTADAKAGPPVGRLHVGRAGQLVMSRLAVVAALSLLAAGPLAAQAPAPGQAGRGGPPPTAQAAARMDLTGYWVSVVSEDWLWRMVTPPRGDVASVPLNAAGIRAAGEWDLTKDNSSGNQCKAFGAGGIMRIPGRLRFSWQDANTLKVETDAGTQTRLFHFSTTGSQPARSLQGFSVASWETGAPAGGGGGGFGSFGAGAGGGMKVVTTQLSPGYLRKNGVPYGQNAVVTEYFDRHLDFGAEWFTVTTIVEDSQYLNQPFITRYSLQERARWLEVESNDLPH